MKRRTAFSPPALGGSSLLVIFGVLCLSVFALLSLSTVQADRRLSDTAARAVTDYYAADLEAETIFARLRSGELPPEVTRRDSIYSYQLPISPYQTLYVELWKEDGGWSVLRWQAVAHPAEPGDSLPVWEGQTSSHKEN